MMIINIDNATRCPHSQQTRGCKKNLQEKCKSGHSVKQSGRPCSGYWPPGHSANRPPAGLKAVVMLSYSRLKNYGEEVNFEQITFHKIVVTQPFIFRLNEIVKQKEEKFYVKKSRSCKLFDFKHSES